MFEEFERKIAEIGVLDVFSTLARAFIFLKVERLPTVRSCERLRIQTVDNGKEVPVSRSFAEHVSDDVWGDFIENRLSAAAAAKIQGHLNTGCEKCAREWESWKRLLGAFEQSRAATPPASVLHRAFDIFDSFVPQPTLLERILASLVFDSRQNAMPAMARASTGSAFNLVYTAGGANVQLWCEFDGMCWQVTGQALPADSFWSVAAVGANNEVKSDADDSGEFRLADLTPGQYDLVIRGARQEVVIPVVHLEDT